MRQKQQLQRLIIFQLQICIKSQSSNYFVKLSHFFLYLWLLMSTLCSSCWWFYLNIFNYIVESQYFASKLEYFSFFKLFFLLNIGFLNEMILAVNNVDELSSSEVSWRAHDSWSSDVNASSSSWNCVFNSNFNLGIFKFTISRYDINVRLFTQSV
jgi:hypothetical protein